MICMCQPRWMDRDRAQPTDARQMKVGWVLRQSKKLKMWKRRFVVLTARDLRTYKNESSRAKATSVIDLSLCERAHGADGQTGFPRSFRVDVPPSDIWYFRCRDDADKASWMQSINDAAAAAQENAKAPGSMVPALPGRFSRDDSLAPSLPNNGEGETFSVAFSSLDSSGSSTMSASWADSQRASWADPQQAQEHIKKHQRLLLESRKVESRRRAAQSLLKFGPAAAREALPALQRVIEAPEPDVETRKVAVQVLCRAEAEIAHIILPVIRKALEDSEPPVRRAAAEGLGALGHACPAECFPALQNAMVDVSWTVRRVAVSSIAKLAVAAPEAAADAYIAAQLAHTLQTDEDEFVRAYCAEALGRLGSHQEALCVAVREDRSVEVRRYALEALAVLKQELDLSAVEVVGRWLLVSAGMDESCLHAAAEGLSLASPGPAAARAAEILAQALAALSSEEGSPADGNGMLRRCIAEALCTFGTAASFAAVQLEAAAEATDDPDLLRQLAATRAQVLQLPDDFESVPPPPTSFKFSRRTYMAFQGASF